MTIVAVSDEAYLPRLEVLVASMLRNYPDARVHLHLINVSDERAQAIGQMGTTLTYTREVVHIEDVKQFAAYCANVRARVIGEVLKRGDPLVVYMDADSIVRRSLHGLYALIRNYDVLLLRQDSVKPVSGEHLIFAAGVIVCKNTPVVQDFVRKWRLGLESHIYEWFADQIQLARAVSASGITVGALPFSYIDWTFSPFSYVWAGKGDKKNENRLYILEERRYARRRIWSMVVTIQQIPLFMHRTMRRTKIAFTTRLVKIRDYVIRKNKKSSNPNPIT